MIHFNIPLVFSFLSVGLLVNNVHGRSLAELIVGGDLVNSGEFLYQVSVKVNGQPFCGGAIISDYHVLSAAHCIVDPDGQFETDRYSVIAGVKDLELISIHFVEVPVEKAYVPKQFMDYLKYDHIRSFMGDISVLKLAAGLGIGRNRAVREVNLPAILPKESASSYSSFANEKAFVSGFGYNNIAIIKNPITEEEKKIPSRVDYKMRFAETLVIDNEACSKLVVEPIFYNHICAKVKQRSPITAEGTCKGDSGSPLVINNVIIGVLSMGRTKCDEVRSPAIYTRVTSFLPFIHDVLNNVDSPNICSTTYNK